MTFTQQQHRRLFTQIALALSGLVAPWPFSADAISADTLNRPKPSTATSPSPRLLQTQLTAEPANQPSASTPDLPFIGTRLFNFAGGNGTVNSIEITSDGITTVQLIGLYDSHTYYRGPFSNPVMLNDGRGLRIEGNKIVELFANEDTARTCRIQKTPCEATLYEPTINP